MSLKMVCLPLSLLNKVVEIIFGTDKIAYIYSSAGVKVQKRVTEAGVVTLTDYLEGFQYVGGALSFLPTAEGFFTAEANAYVYQYRDHLGNVRLSYSDKNENNIIEVNEIIAETNYYPFGLSHKGYNEKNDALMQDYKYRYNGKESQEELGLNYYDYGARHYDAAIGRWMSVDPLAEKYYDISPYAYVANNPIMFIDPDGRDYRVFFDSKTKTATIKATYYALSKDMSSAQQATEYWNNQSGNFNYKVGKNENAANYKVNFELSVVEVNSDENIGDRGSLNQAFIKDKSGEANIYSIDNSGLDANTNGRTIGGTLIKVKDSERDADTGAHEVGHSLGLGHSDNGLMTPASTDSRRSKNVYKREISNILKNSLNNKTTPGAGRGTINNNTNSTQKELAKGKVQ